MGDDEGCSNLGWKAVFTSSARAFVCLLWGVWVVVEEMALLQTFSIRFHHRQERGNTARVCIPSWCRVSSKHDAVAAKNVQASMSCKLHSWFLLNKTLPRHLASKCCVSQDTALVLIPPTLKWVLALVSKIRIVFHLSWSVTRQFSFNWIVLFKCSPRPNVKSSHSFPSCFVTFHPPKYRTAGLVSLLK